MTSTITPLATEALTLTDGRAVTIKMDRARSAAEFVFRAQDRTGAVVGLAVCDPEGLHAGIAVTVTPAWRRAGLGTALLQRAAQEAGRRQVSWLILHYPAGHKSLTRWLNGSGLVTARRVSNGMVRAAVLAPGAFDHGAQAA